MTKLIAEYHAISYAMKIKQPDTFKDLVAGITSLSFVADKGERNLYGVLYDVAFHRYFEYIDRLAAAAADSNPIAGRSEKFMRDMTNLRNKYGKNPVGLLEWIRQSDDVFSVILHGDYNRNNVLFRYDNGDGHENPDDGKMIDFQVFIYGLCSYMNV